MQDILRSPSPHNVVGGDIARSVARSPVSCSPSIISPSRSLSATGSSQTHVVCWHARCAVSSARHDMPVDEAVRAARDAGRNYITIASEFLARPSEELTKADK